MNILVNGKPRNVNATQLLAVLIELGYDKATIATAVNRRFIPIATRAHTTLSENDRLEIVAPMQGG